MQSLARNIAGWCGNRPWLDHRGRRNRPDAARIGRRIGAQRAASLFRRQRAIARAIRAPVHLPALGLVAIVGFPPIRLLPAFGGAAFALRGASLGGQSAAFGSSRDPSLHDSCPGLTSGDEPQHATLVGPFAAISARAIAIPIDSLDALRTGPGLPAADHHRRPRVQSIRIARLTSYQLLAGRGSQCRRLEFESVAAQRRVARSFGSHHHAAKPEQRGRASRRLSAVESRLPLPLPYRVHRPHAWCDGANAGARRQQLELSQRVPEDAVEHGGDAAPDGALGRPHAWPGRRGRRGQTHHGWRSFLGAALGCCDGGQGFQRRPRGLAQQPGPQG